MQIDRQTIVGKCLLVGMVLIVLFFGPGCAGTQENSGSMEPTEEKMNAAAGPVPLYYDFADILIPAELSLDRKNSFVYSTPSFSTGVLAFEGYVKGDSLVDFFSSNMDKDGWLLKSSFRYRKTILSFEKGERSCLVQVAEYPLKTKVEIWVAPQSGPSVP
jgi:hypothetical protein